MTHISIQANAYGFPIKKRAHVVQYTLACFSIVYIWLTHFALAMAHTPQGHEAVAQKTSSISEVCQEFTNLKNTPAIHLSKKKIIAIKMR